MRGFKPIVVATAALFAAALGTLEVAAQPRRVGDPEHGLDLAKRWCASCHVVSADQKRASADVPPFATIAKIPDFSAARLAQFLLNPHPKMPELPLSRAAADDLTAYILSLNK
jgi:mono/diheme cytochrome c family protein